MELEKRKHLLPLDDNKPKKKRLMGRKLSLSKLNSHTLISQALSQPDQPDSSSEEEKENQPPIGSNIEIQETEVPNGVSATCKEKGSNNDAGSVSCSVSHKGTISTTDFSEDVEDRYTMLRTCSGKRYLTEKKQSQTVLSYERLIASRSSTTAGHAQKSFYGIDIHNLIDRASIESKSSLPSSRPAEPINYPSIESAQHGKSKSRLRMMWTEKYRARKFIDLVGDERTHRTVLKWLKGWDPIVFPGVSRPKPMRRKQAGEEPEERAHRKILLLTGAPGLGKTTLAHVCARQAGYEVVEINASDERGRDVVKGRIKDCVGTENVRGVNVTTTDGTVRSAGRPICVVVDEVDGVVSGSSNAGGEGGFIKALIDLILLDQKNSTNLAVAVPGKKSKKGDRFKLLRPMILVCNDVYHPSLKPFRASNLAEIIHIRKPPLDKIVTRMKTVFDKEGIMSDTDGVRRMCEATWGISNRRENRSLSSNTAEGDIRSVLVVGEMVASRLQASGPDPARLTRQWVESNLLDTLSNGGAAARSMGRGGAKEVLERVFVDGAGFSKPAIATSDDDPFAPSVVPKKTSVTDHNKRHALTLLGELISTSGEPDRVITDCFSSYPEHPFQDDTFLSKPNSAYEWLHFHDSLSSRVFSDQSWELDPYMSQSILAFHHLFASSARKPQQNAWGGEQGFGHADAEADPMPFSGPRADYAAFEAERANRALLQQLQSTLSIPLTRAFRRPEELAVELVPYLVRMLTPAVKPIIVGGSGESRGMASVRREEEKEMVRRGAEVMGAVGITFERVRIDDGRGGFVFRMEPAADTLATFETAAISASASSARYAVRQVLDQEYQQYLIRQRTEARQARFSAGGPTDAVAFARNGQASSEKQPYNHQPKANSSTKVKRDFFGRIISTTEAGDAHTGTRQGRRVEAGSTDAKKGRIWVSYNEGYSNAVKKKITLAELMRGM